jgi:hypothetical protein
MIKIQIEEDLFYTIWTDAKQLFPDYDVNRLDLPLMPLA